AAPDRSPHPLDALGAALLAGATGTFMLMCIWGGDRYAWASAQIVALASATAVLTLLVVGRERRPAEPMVSLGPPRTPVGAVGTATTGFFRALGGAVGAAVFGAVFAARAGVNASAASGHALRGEVIDGVQAVFLIAAPLAALALAVVLLLPETPLQTRSR